MGKARKDLSKASLSLNREQQKLYDETTIITKFVASQFVRAYPGKAQYDELIQVARIALAHAAQRWDESRGVPFRRYANRIVQWECKWHVFGGNNRRILQHEVSWNAPAGENIVQGDLAEASLAKSETQSDIVDENLAARLHDIRRAIETHIALTPLERQLLHMHFSDGLEHKMIARRLRRSVSNVHAHLRTAVKKLRRVLPGALPQDAPMPNFGNRHGCPKKRRKSS